MRKYCKLLPVCFVATTMLQLDVQVQRHIRPVNPVASLVGTLEALLDLSGEPPVFLAIFEAVKLLVLLTDVLHTFPRTSTSLTCF